MPVAQILVVFWQSSVFLVLKVYHLNFCLHVHIAFFLCVCLESKSALYKDTSHIGLETHPTPV